MCPAIDVCFHSRSIIKASGQRSIIRTMKKILSISFLILSVQSVFSQGIEFEHGSWSEVVNKAKKLNKPIFVDVYTSWCGPCKLMTAQVFPRPEIGTTYNQGFVNVKIDAEKGEGIFIAKKYEVKSYPTYLFINPFDESLVDRSKSSMAATDFNDLGDKMLNKFHGKKESNLAEMDAKYQTGNFDEVFARDYIKRLKAEGKTINEALGKYISRFVTNTPSTDQLYFLGLNFPAGADSILYSYMINNYKSIDAVLCKKDGIAAASVYRTFREETKSRIEYTLNSKETIPAKEVQLNKLFADIKTVEIEERANKKILEYKILFYHLNADTLQRLQATRSYIIQFLLPPGKTATIGSETIILDKNAPVPVLPIDSIRVSDFCSSYAVSLSKLSKDVQDKDLAAALLKKALTLNNSFVIKNRMNIARYNFGEREAAIVQQSNMIAEMKNSNDEYIPEAETTIRKMKNNEPNLTGFSYKRKPIKSH